MNACTLAWMNHERSLKTWGKKQKKIIIVIEGLTRDIKRGARESREPHHDDQEGDSGR